MGNESVVLMFICLISLIRIAITGYAFQSLQASQERLLGEQKLWIRCSVAQNIGAETIDVKEANFGLNGVVIEESHSDHEESPQMEENKFRRLTEQKEDGGGITTVKVASTSDDDDAGNSEAKPLLSAHAPKALAVQKSVVERKVD